MDRDTQIHLEDEYGAEIDREIFPVFVNQQDIPNVVLRIFGEEQEQLVLSGKFY